ncbi:P-type conjugative transfer protein TrbG [Hirschia baltica]|uniref:P-type conjugative transfer protein TrbG n=1 Tax=Hirschia baltica (strain ATCC 49814 / DSM 5838 / IFAM 1418) TaxID=582402 RepID=C6XNV7_HIRBI|nr:P-type conjugative transfer protein TrbG [Hirschia baltica]ACT58360.1 P-type conjugative transfer protein TrbG [Hirschia baltica ATCC 49814]
MIRKSLLASVSLLLVTACTTTEVTPITPKDFIAARPLEDLSEHPVQIVETTVPLPLPGQMKKIGPQAPSKKKITPEQAIKEGRQHALIEPSVDGYVNAIQIYPYTEGALYRLYASPGQISDIALQVGEELVSVSAGDTVRWVVGDTLSGSGSTSRAHVLVKPISADIRTNLMIATNKRTYHLELESVSSGYMAALSWRYPKDAFAELTTKNDRAHARAANSIESGLTLEDLNFDYKLTGQSPPWKPVRVFDDGAQVFIQMPENIKTSDMPPLFVVGQSGDAELVNYRIKNNYYIVDRLFRAAELRLGTKRQTIVRIERVKARTGLAALFGS